MSWICKQCETENTDDVIECEVCNAISPYLSRFDYEIGEDNQTSIKWKAEYCDRLKLSYKGHVIDVTHQDTARIPAKRDTEVTFILESDVAIRKCTYAIRELPHPAIGKASDDFIGSYCIICGSRISIGDNYCINCGRELI